MLKITNFIAYLIFLFPAAYLIKFNFLNLEFINLLDFLILFFIIVFLITIKKRSWEKDLVIFLKNKQLFLFSVGIIFCGIIVSSLKNFNYENYLPSLGLIKSFFILPIVFALFLIFLIKKRVIDKYLCLFLYFIYASFLGILGLLFSLFDKLTYDQRLELFFNSPNFLAMSLAPGIIIGVFYLIYNPKIKFSFSKNRLLLIFLLLIQLFSFGLTKSLGAYLSVFIAIIFLLLYQINFSPKKWFYPSFIFVLLSSLIVFLNFSSLLKHNQYQPSQPPSSIDSRIAIYQASEKIIKNNWLVGIGLNNFQKEYLNYQKFFPPYPQWAVPHSHNLLTHLWSEIGIIGILGFVFILFLFFSRFSTKQKTPFRILVGALMIYFLIHGLVDMSIWKNDLSLFFWLLVFII